MKASETQPKDVAKQRAGLVGARARWGPPRVIRLDELTAGQRRLVEALIQAARDERAAELDLTETA